MTAVSSCQEHQLVSTLLFSPPAPTRTYTLSLHDALPISRCLRPRHAIRDDRLRALGARRRVLQLGLRRGLHRSPRDRKSTRLNSSHVETSYAAFCLKKKKVTPGHPFAAVQ